MRPPRLKLVSLALAMAVGTRAATARADVAVRADRVDIDLRSDTLEARGNVRADAPPFHFSSERVKLARFGEGSEGSVDLEGAGRVSFCRCLGTPLAIAFDGARLTPPDDVVLRQPRLEVFGVPVLWAPIFWLRSPARVGLLPPDVTYRGADGLFLGEGVHVPWREGDATHGLDLRAGAYLNGGAAVDARLFTDASATRARWDHLGGDGLAVDARGAAGVVAWDVDVLRGARGVVSTTDLDAAARPFDRASAEASWRAGGFTVASGVRATGLRGGEIVDVGASGPSVVARRGDAIGNAGAYDVAIEGGALRSTARSTLAFARTEAGALLAAPVGPVLASLTSRGIADVASDGLVRGVDAAGSARAALAMPLARAFASADRDDPWVHRLEPRIEAGVMGARASDVVAGGLGRSGVFTGAGAAWLATAGVASAAGRWGSGNAAELDVAAGITGGPAAAQPLLRARATLSQRLLRLSGEAAHVFGEGHAFVARARVGPASGVHLSGHVAARAGVDPIAARALTDAALEPTSGFLATEGWTAAGRLAIPWTSRFVTRGGVDMDLTNERLVAAAAAIELHDPCGCVVVRASGAHRIGREGVDVWLTIDLAPPR